MIFELFSASYIYLPIFGLFYTLITGNIIGIYFFIMSVIVQFFVTFLKKLFSSYPFAVRPIDNKLTDGFPSGHSALALFFYIFWQIYIYENTKSHISTSFILRSTLLFLFSISIVFSRVFYKFHSPLQAIVGSIIGIVFGLISYLLILAIRYVFC